MVQHNGEEIDICLNKQELMTQNEALSVGNAHSPRGGGQTNNPTANIQGTLDETTKKLSIYNNFCLTDEFLCYTTCIY